MSIHQDEDASAISVRVRERDDAVVLEFDKAVSWIALEPVQAIKVAEQMRCEAISILRSSPKPR